MRKFFAILLTTVMFFMTLISANATDKRDDLKFIPVVKLVVLYDNEHSVRCLTEDVYLYTTNYEEFGDYDIITISGKTTNHLISENTVFYVNDMVAPIIQICYRDIQTYFSVKLKIYQTQNTINQINLIYNDYGVKSFTDGVYITAQSIKDGERDFNILHVEGETTYYLTNNTIMVLNDEVIKYSYYQNTVKPSITYFSFDINIPSRELAPPTFMVSKIDVFFSDNGAYFYYDEISKTDNIQMSSSENGIRQIEGKIPFGIITDNTVVYLNQEPVEFSYTNTDEGSTFYITLYSSTTNLDTNNKIFNDIYTLLMNIVYKFYTVLNFYAGI